MTNEEIEIQMALGTLKPKKLNVKEFKHYTNVKYHQVTRNIVSLGISMEEAEEGLKDFRRQLDMVNTLHERRTHD